MSLSAAPGRRQARQPIRVLFNARFALPAGEYAIELRRSPRAQRMTGTLGLQVGRIGQPMISWPVEVQGGGDWQQRFTLPLDSEFVGFRASPELEAALDGFTLRPLHVIDARRRWQAPPVLAASSYGSSVLFFHDEQAWPERAGFWTRGSTTVPVTIKTHAETVVLRVHSGARPNRVTFETGGWREQLALEPHKRRDVEVPAGSAGLIPLRISTETGFVPADLEPGSSDKRLLGCWIEVNESPSPAVRARFPPWGEGRAEPTKLPPPRG
jgi:hypothetical protein